MRKQFDQEQRPGWFWRFLRGGLSALVLSAIVVAVLSLYVLPPPAPPPPPAETAEDDGEPKMIGGIEVSDVPAYSTDRDAAGTDAAASDEPAAGAEAAVAPAPESLMPVELSGPAIEVNAAAFDAPPETPLVAVVLDDTAANPLLHELLFSVKVPLTVGVVAGSGGDRETATAARNAGFEVVAQLPLAQQGQSAGAGLEYGLPTEEANERTAILMQRLPVAIGATRPLAAIAPPNSEVLRGVLGALTPLGFAYVDHGVMAGWDSPAASVGVDGIIGVSRHQIPAGADAAQTIAVMDRAAAEAVNTGGAVVFATPSEDTILALQFWASEGSGGRAVLAPLSAVIRRQIRG